MAALNNITSPPDIAQDDSAVALKKVQNYLYSLQEQLRFMFSNLGVENLNSSSLNELETVLTGGVKTKIQDAMDNVADLRLAADGLQLSFSDAEGNLSSLHQDVTGLTSTVESQDGAISTLAQTVDGLSLTVINSEGDPSIVNLSSGQLDLQGLVFSVLGTEGATEIDGGNIKTNTLSANVIEGGTINASVAITGTTINGSTINGGTINSGTINSGTINGGTFSTFGSSGNVGKIKIEEGEIKLYSYDGVYHIGSIWYNDCGTLSLSALNGAELYLYSHGNMHMVSNYDLDITAEKAIRIISRGADLISKLDLTSNDYGIRVNYNGGGPLVVPIHYKYDGTSDGSNGEIDLGHGSYPFKNIYLKYSPNIGSDERMKKEINDIDAKQACAFVDALNVVSYLYKTDDDDHKKRIGLLAGKMKEIDPAFADFFVDEDEKQMLSLRPSDLVFALIPKIQAQQKTIDELKDKVMTQQQTIADLFVNVEALKSRIALL